MWVRAFRVTEFRVLVSRFGDHVVLQKGQKEGGGGGSRDRLRAFEVLRLRPVFSWRVSGEKAEVSGDSSLFCTLNPKP